MSDTYTHCTCIFYEVVVFISQCCFLGSFALPYMVSKKAEIWDQHVLCSSSSLRAKHLSVSLGIPTENSAYHKMP